MSKSQPHRKKIRHFHDLGDFHELTFSCYHRMPILTNDDWRRRLSSARYYLLDPPRQQFPDLPFIHGIRPEALERGQPR